MLDEMERRYLKAGYGLRVVYYYRYRTEKFFDNKDEALKHFRRAQELARDELSDCAACEIDERVTFQAYCGEDELVHHYEISQMKEWFESRAREIGERFDKRNGTNQIARELAETLALKELKRS